MSRTRRSRRSSTTTGSDPRRWAHLIFVVGGFMAAWVLTNLIESVWSVAFDYWPQIGRANAMVSNLAGITIAIAATGWAWRKPEWFRYVLEVVTEVSQIVWPTKAEVRVATVVVIVMTLICSVLLFGIDASWLKVTNLLYGI